MLVQVRPPTDETGARALLVVVALLVMVSGFWVLPRGRHCHFTSIYGRLQAFCRTTGSMKFDVNTERWVPRTMARATSKPRRM